MAEIDGFARSAFEHGGFTHDVYRAGDGPPVVVIHEMPGITPSVADFARRVVARGFTVFMPTLFGEPGRALSPGYALKTMLGGCVSKEFVNWAVGETSPKVAWCRALAKSAHEELGGPGVGAVGMCFTGGFALAMMIDDILVAPVLSQPSLPFALGRARKRDLAISPSDLARVKERAREGQCVLGLRFTGDPLVPAERFQRLRDELGDRFLAVEIDSSPGNPWKIPRSAHSVLTHHFVDEPGHPTRDALERVLGFFDERLRPATQRA